MLHWIWLPFGALDFFLTYTLSFSLLYTLDSLPFKPQNWYGIYIQNKRIFHSDICKLSTCWGIRLDHLAWASPSSKKWLVKSTQPDLLSYAIVSLIISIGQYVLTRWQKSNTSKSLILARVYWLDGISLWGLPKTIGPDIYTCLEWF